MELFALAFGDDDALGAGHMAARAALVFFITLCFIRFSGRRSFGQRTSFDSATTVLLGAVLSRAVVGASPFLATIAAAAVLVVLHRLLGWLSVRWDQVDVLVNGRERIIVSDGQPNSRELEWALVTRRDLDEAIRKKIGRVETGAIKTAMLERDGEITLVLGAAK